MLVELILVAKMWVLLLCYTCVDTYSREYRTSLYVLESVCISTKCISKIHISSIILMELYCNWYSKSVLIHHKSKEIRFLRTHQLYYLYVWLQFCKIYYYRLIPLEIKIAYNHKLNIIFILIILNRYNSFSNKQCEQCTNILTALRFLSTI